MRGGRNDNLLTCWAFSHSRHNLPSRCLLDVTLEARKSGPGRVIYEISGAPEGLDVTIEPSQFMAQPETVYHSTIAIEASPELVPGEYRLSFGQNFERVFSGVGHITVNVE